MNNSTPGDLLTSSKNPSSSRQQSSEENLQELHLPADEIAPVQQVMNELDTLQFSPRTATIKAILQYARHKEEETVH